MEASTGVQHETKSACSFIMAASQAIILLFAYPITVIIGTPIKVFTVNLNDTFQLQVIPTSRLISSPDSFSFCEVILPHVRAASAIPGTPWLGIKNFQLTRWRLNGETQSERGARSDPSSTWRWRKRDNEQGRSRYDIDFEGSVQPQS